jgi:hypothetical protein
MSLTPWNWTCSAWVVVRTEIASRWQEAQRKELCDLATGDVSMAGRCRAMVIEIPSSELTILRRAAARKVYDRQPISA